MSTDVWSTGDRHDPDRQYATAVTITDVHTGHCPTCVAGGVCGRADQLMDDEFRTYETWRTSAPDAARAYDRADWPTEG